MTTLELYNAICWHDANYSLIEDRLIDLQHEYPQAWKEIPSLDTILNAVAIGKLNARETRRGMRLDATRLLED